LSQWTEGKNGLFQKPVLLNYAGGSRFGEPPWIYHKTLEGLII